MNVKKPELTSDRQDANSLIVIFMGKALNFKNLKF